MSSDSLPERPDLDQLRRRAKELRDAVLRGDGAAMQRFADHHPSARPDAVSLAAAQLVIARELGFSSWPRLKAVIDADNQSRRTVSAFLNASVEGRLQHARDMLAAEPDLAERSLLTATVLGDVATARQFLAADPAAAVAVDDERGWPPLLYACYSHWHQIDPDRTHGIVDVVRLLLETGANPNTNDGGRPRFRSALKGSVEVNNPDVTELLLNSGAHPDLGQPIGEAAGRSDHRCLQLLLVHGARIARTWAVGAAVFADNADATRLLLDALSATDAASAKHEATGALLDAMNDSSLPVILALLDGGADPQAVDDDGMSALRLAVRAGKNDVAERLRAAGATDDGSDVDRFIGACLNADRDAAEQLLAEHADLLGRLNDQDRAVIVEAAGPRSVATIALMLELGFSHQARNHFGEQPLHSAAYYGNAAVVRLLLDAGAEVDARDTRFDGTPLGFATVGSGEHSDEQGDWIDAVRMLLDAGASRRDVWITQKPPSEQVMDLLRSYGIGPDEPVELGSGPGSEGQEDEPELPDSLGTGVLAELAGHLEAAYSNRDLDLLASLLHPEVHWTGECTNRTQVIEWYRTFMNSGTVAMVRSVEVDRDAVVLTLVVGGLAEGARQGPSQQRCQVFTIDGAQIIDIRGYPDRRSALARA